MGKNGEIARTAAEAFGRGDMETLVPLIAEDVLVHVPGSNQLSGTYKSRDELLNNFVGTLMQLTGGQVQFQVHDVTDSDEHATGIYNLTVTRDGKTFEYRQVNVYHLRGGQIAEIFVSIHDFEPWNAFWQ